MCVSDATEDLGQYIVMEVVCCFMGALKKRKKVSVFKPVISGVRVKAMLQVAACAKSN